MRNKRRYHTSEEGDPSITGGRGAPVGGSPAAPRRQAETARLGGARGGMRPPGLLAGAVWWRSENPKNGPITAQALYLIFGQHSVKELSDD